MSQTKPPDFLYKTHKVFGGREEMNLEAALNKATTNLVITIGAGAK